LTETLEYLRSEESHMGLLSTHEEKVWTLFQQGHSTSEIPDLVTDEEWSAAYVSRVLNRARKKIEKALRDHAHSHRLDVESVLDYKGLLIGYDYQANSAVYIVFTIRHGIVIWYAHQSWGGKLCPECPKNVECRETLDTIMDEYDIQLRPDEQDLYMTQQSIVIFNKLAAKEIPRYARKGKE
jgi:hypothetical protein